ncbi:MAG: HEPN domain-containing protein [Sphingobacteriales bacterium]|nr:HEPN domain-containing protein [Sphingobacteriales bacterium]MBI3719984.1 HEPN domain-containing protein [Sphingobacteriales bacterium]
MATFDEHIQQAKRNFDFLCLVNQKVNDHFDWQVTVCFYTALHLVNAHLSKHNLQYRKHHDVNYALNPDVQLSVSKLPEEEYDSYIALQRLSRRSRYLVNEKDNNISSTQAFFTYDKHLAKAIRNLDKLIRYFDKKYTLEFNAKNFSCIELTKKDNLKFSK